MKTNWKTLGTLLLLASSLGAHADGPQGWGFEIMPYFWYAGLEGDLKMKGQEIEFDKSAGDLMKTVRGGGSLLTVVQYNRMVFWGQADSINLSTDELDAKDQPQRGGLNSNIFIAEGAVGYQVDGWSEGQTFDLMVGVRSASIDNEFKFNNAAKLERQRDVFDPMFLVRPSIPLFASRTNKLRFNPVLGIGGGGDSEMAYEMFPQVQWHFTNHLAIRLGYRTIGWKIKDSNENELNIRLAGLIFGLGGTF